MNKYLIGVAFVAASLVAPSLSFAQSAAPVTRASIRIQMAALEKAGYNPAENNPNYPANLQAAEAKVERMQAQSNASMGGISTGEQSGSGAPELS